MPTIILNAEMSRGSVQKPTSAEAAISRSSPAHAVEQTSNARGQTQSTAQVRRLLRRDHAHPHEGRRRE